MCAHSSAALMCALREFNVSLTKICHGHFQNRVVQQTLGVFITSVTIAFLQQCYRYPQIEQQLTT